MLVRSKEIYVTLLLLFFSFVKEILTYIFIKNGYRVMKRKRKE